MTMRAIKFSTAVVGLFAYACCAFAQQSVGRFDGEVVAKFMRDGRNMQVEQTFAYIDPAGRRWEVPAGTITDGASVPQGFWVCCPPFSGKYRSAAVVHDYYCQTKSRSWKETHLTFYNAMRASGVTESQAKAMYGAVYSFGPRWGTGLRGVKTGAPVAEQQKVFADLESWIERENPSLEEIGRRLDDGKLPVQGR